MSRAIVKRFFIESNPCDIDMNNPSESKPDLAERAAELERDRLQDGASVADQPESGTSRRNDEIRQSAASNPRRDDSTAETQSPEEA